MLKRENSYSLSGSWRFIIDREDRGGELGYMFPTLNESLWRECTIPCTYETAAQECGGYAGTIWFRRRFTAEITTNTLCFLEFLAVNHRADVWLNGYPVGSHLGGYIPFRFEVSALLCNGENLLCVRVNNRRVPGDLPATPFWRCHGGIIRDVNLYTTPRCVTESVRVTEEGDPLLISTRIRNYGPSAEKLQLTISIDDGIYSSSDTVWVPAGESITAKVSLYAPDLSRWSPDSPNLHTVTAILSCNGWKSHVTDRFGLRKISVKDGRICLDGHPITLRGFNRHEDSPQKQLATDVALSAADFRQIKMLNGNFVRFCHYPHSEEELSLCDELGLLVLSELSLCAALEHTTAEEQSTVSIQQANLPEYYHNARVEAESLIDRDYNHPSIIIWSASNETNEAIQPMRLVNDALVRYLRALDPSRLCIHVSMAAYVDGGIPVDDPLYVYDDLICFNAYCAMGARRGEFTPESRAKVTNYWKRVLSDLSEKYPGKPILITEFGCPTERYRDAAEDERGQTEAILADFDEIDGRVAGCAIWCFADHTWEINEQGRPINSARISSYGVFTRNRHPKAAADAIRIAYGKAFSRENNPI